MRAPLVAILVVLGAIALAPSAGAAEHPSAEAAKVPTDILQDATAAMNNASVVLVTGTVETDNGRVTVRIVSGHGTGGGVMFLNGQKFNIVVASPNVFLKGSPGAWTAITGRTAAGPLLGGRWIQSTTADESFGGLAFIADVSSLTQSMLKVSGTLTKGPVTDFQGHKAIPLRDDGSSPGTLYVAATGAPYPLGIVRGTGQAGQLVFSRYGTAKIPAPPKQYVALSELQAAAGN